MYATSRNIILSLVAILACGAAVAQTPQNILWQTTASKAIAISPDAQLMLTGIQVRHTSDGSLVRTFQFGYSTKTVNADAFSPDGRLAALGLQAFNQNLFVFRVDDGVKVAGPISAHNNGTTSVVFSPNGELLASGGRDGTVKLWHVPDMTLVRTLSGGVGYSARVFAVVFSKDGSSVVLGGQGGVLQYRVSDGQLLRQLTTVNTASLAICGDGTVLSSGHNQIDQYGQCVDCTVKVWRMSDGARLGTLEGNDNGVISLSYSADQHELAVGAGDRVHGGSIRFYSTIDGTLLGTWFQDPNNGASYITAIAYAPFGNMIAYARGDTLVTAALDPFLAY